MDGVSGPRGYGAFTGPVAGDGSVSILRKAVDAAKSGTGGVDDPGAAASRRPDISVDGVVDITSDDATSVACATSRPIGNVGQHLDLRL